MFKHFTGIDLIVIYTRIIFLLTVILQCYCSEVLLACFVLQFYSWFKLGGESTVPQFRFLTSTMDPAKAKHRVVPQLCIIYIIILHLFCLFFSFPSKYDGIAIADLQSLSSWVCKSRMRSLPEALNLQPLFFTQSNPKQEKQNSQKRLVKPPEILFGLQNFTG